MNDADDPTRELLDTTAMHPEFDYRGFIRRNTRLMPVPLVPEISLYMADDATELWEHTEADLDRVGLPPPFWAFAWAGGQALARYLLDRPGLLGGARVLDFASGSGLVAIAASLGDVGTTTANDIDAFACAAASLNAEANGVAVDICCTDLRTREDEWDVVLAADIFYERDTADAVTAWLQRLVARGVDVLVGDPGRAYFDRSLFEPLARYDVPVMRSLEDADIKPSSVWRLRPKP